MNTETVDMGAQVGSVAPGDLVICRGWLVPVQRVVIHPPNTVHAGPIVPSMYAVEAITQKGSRWAGGANALIRGDLRAHWERGGES